MTNDGHTTPSPQAQELASRAADAMWRDDHASQALGMEIQRIGPGTAEIAMTIRTDMVNGLGVAHGGFIFLLADSTFAFACNSYNQRTVAAGAEIHFLAPAHEGDRLTAVCQEVHRGGRSGIYDVTVRRQDGTRVAVFRGRSASVKGVHVE
ncbi:MAG: hydroxyphenylacetyl-CoA thioesterase PaaI [Burkholderiaceae bacterium]